MQVKSKPATEYKICAFCQCRMSADYKVDLCPSCVERVLFAQVRDFIRSGDYNEYEVAQEFGIPLKKVKDWIREGRIEYKESPEKKLLIDTGRCVVCGKPTLVESICRECEDRLHKRGFGFSDYRFEDGEIRFLKDSTKRIEIPKNKEPVQKGSK
ncbi:MAG: hypothetical protein K6E56_04110 [Lachnospiraceae bacterium]|nr:hypothetical protein [Lachnospiraceae bacterium]